MRINQKVPPVNHDTSPSPLRIKEGRVKLILTDRDGHEEVVADHNMATNGINAMLANCGWLNRDNLNQGNLVEELIGGVLLLDTAMTEQASNYVIPDGVGMTANGAVGEVNTGSPLELGSWNETDSGGTARGRGWQADGSYLEVFDWLTGQGNGTIACVCATNLEFGYCGIGNKLAEVATTKRLTLVGTPTEYYIPGAFCKVNFTDSTCYAIDFDLTNDKVVISKVQLPITKVNIKASPSVPLVLEETKIDLPSGLKSCIQSLGTSWYSKAALNGVIQNAGDTLNIISRGGSGVWGTDYTPTLWEIDPVNATITTTNLSNTSGDTLHSICQPVWIGANRLAWIDGTTSSGATATADGRYVYSMERSGGTWGTIRKCENPIGSYQASYITECGWNNPIRVEGVASGKGRVYMKGTSSEMVVFSFNDNKCYYCNGDAAQYDSYFATPTSSKMIGAQLREYNDGVQIRLVRQQTAIATIFNLESPVTKTSEKGMKLLYRFTFEEVS